MGMKTYQVVMGGSVKEGGKTFHRYTITGPGGEVLRGARAGRKDEVKRFAQGFVDKLECMAVGKAA